MSRISRRIRRALPPLPEIWSPARIWRWIKARPRRYRRFEWLTGLAVVALLGAAAARPVSHRIKAWQARRLASEAENLIAKEEWANASRKLQDALRIWQNEPEVWRAEGRLLGRVGQNQEAVRWWQKLGESRTLSRTDRRDYAAAALAAHDLPVAEEQVRQLFAGNPTPADVVLAGTLAGLQNYPARAVDYGLGALDDSTATTQDKVAAASLVLSRSPTDSPNYARAYATLVKVARADESADSLHALAILARQPPPTGPSISGSDHRLEGDAANTDRLPLGQIADRLEHHSKARPFHRILALEVRARTNPDQADNLINQAINTYANGDDETLGMLAVWLYTRQKFQAMLKVLPLERVIRNRELFIQRVDALAALGRYSDVQDMLLSEQSVIDPSTQHMFLAVVKAKLGEAVASANEWDRALDEADSLHRLLALANYAEKNGALETADAAYARAISKQPGVRPAYAARLRLAQELGDTARAHKIAEEIVRLWPDDLATKTREIYLRLLLDSSAPTARAAEQELGAILAKNPWDKSAQTALALARLRQGRTAAALEAAPQPGPGVPASVPLAVAWAANGWRDRADEEVRKLATVKLLPEERALLAPLVTRK
jgi:thioredoxin-like negative regulator of GroEL